jgi:excisionase family DNA binding protein
MPETSVYTLAEAAELLGVHYETVARWVRTGKLGGVKLSRRKVVIPKERLDALLAGSGPGREAPPLEGVGSPQRWLALAGTLSPSEAEALRASTRDFELIEEE